VLVGQPQPADALAAAQPHALGGVHLPDGVGGGGAAGVLPGPAAARGRCQAGAAEPALQGPGRRQGDGGELAAQQDADQRRPPGRVSAAHLQGRLPERRGGGGTAVVGRQGALAAAAEARQQAADGARGQAQFAGDGAGALAAAEAAEANTAERGGDGARHGKPSNAPRYGPG